MKRTRIMVVCALTVFTANAPCAAGPVNSMEDIRYWVGTGNHRAALVIDWNDDATTDPALVWGFRWDGSATGVDLLTAVLAADSRLFAKLGGNPTEPNRPDRVFGLGYDATGDGQFELDDGTVFDAEGLVISDASEGAMAVNSEDYYAEGWQTKFWHYGVADTNPLGAGSWTSSQLGVATRTLADGSWDGWALAEPISFSVFAMNPQAAEPPRVRGDYDLDGFVAAADYTVWRDTLGQSVEFFGAGADGDANGSVDADDYTIWKQNYAPLVTGEIAAAPIPEPTTLSLLTSYLAITVLWLWSERFQKHGKAPLLLRRHVS